MLWYLPYRNNNYNDDGVDDDSDYSYCYLNTFLHVSRTNTKYFPCSVPFKPTNNIARQVLYCPILQMKTPRARQTGNSFTHSIEPLLYL